MEPTSQGNLNGTFSIMPVMMDRVPIDSSLARIESIESEFESSRVHGGLESKVSIRVRVESESAFPRLGLDSTRLGLGLDRFEPDSNRLESDSIAGTAALPLSLSPLTKCLHSVIYSHSLLTYFLYSCLIHLTFPLLVCLLTNKAAPHFPYTNTSNTCRPAHCLHLNW